MEHGTSGTRGLCLSFGNNIGCWYNWYWVDEIESVSLGETLFRLEGGINNDGNDGNYGSDGNYGNDDDYGNNNNYNDNNNKEPQVKQLITYNPSNDL